MTSFKTPIQPTTTTLNTADGLPMTALGMTALHLRIVDFKFTHNFIICNRLPDTEITFGIDIQKKVSLSHAWDKEKNCYMQKDGKFLTCTRNCKQKATIGIVKSTPKIPPRHNGVIPIKIKGHSITGHMAYFISNYVLIKGKDPNINIVNGIHNIKGKTSVNILVSNYTNRHIMFNKGEYVGHLEPTIEDTDEGKNVHFKLIQMPISQTVLQPKEWCQNKWNQTLLSHHAINSNQVLKLNLKHYWWSTHLNLHKMKPPTWLL